MAISKLKNLRIDTIKVDYARNPRLAVSYTDQDKEFVALTTAIDIEGFRDDKRLLVSARKMTDGTTEYWLLQGHRRLAAARKVNARDPKKCTELPCIVYEGLSLADEAEMLVDHFGIKTLNDFEQYLAVKSLLMIPLSEEKVAKKIGKSRGFVQRRRWIADAPFCVESEWRKKAEGVEGHVPLTDPILTELKKAQTLDVDAGLDTKDGGPNFLAAWEKLVTTGEVKRPDPKALTRQAIMGVIGMVKDPIGKSFLSYCAGDPVSLPDLCEELAVLRAKAADSDAKASEVAALEAQCLNLIAEVESLRGVAQAV